MSFFEQQPIKLDFDTIAPLVDDPIVQIPSKAVINLNCPIIKVERNVDAEQVKYLLEGEKLFGELEWHYDQVSLLKESFIRNDFALLGQIISSVYRNKIKSKGLEGELFQRVEIDWTFYDFFPGNTRIHYEVFTKRDICAIGARNEN